MHFDIKNFGCNLCKCRYRSKAALKYHVTKFHELNFEEEHMIKFDNQVDLPSMVGEEIIEGLVTNPFITHSFRCKLCNEVLEWEYRDAWQSNYESHDVLQYPCHLCPMICRYPEELQIHLFKVHCINKK